MSNSVLSDGRLQIRELWGVIGNYFSSLFCLFFFETGFCHSTPAALELVLLLLQLAECCDCGVHQHVQSEDALCFVFLLFLF